MDSLENIANLITTVLLSTLIFFAVFDNILIIVVKIHKPLLENKYFCFHRKRGFLKVTFLKLIAILYIVYALLAPTGSSGALAAPIWAYGFFVIKLLFDYIKTKGSNSDIVQAAKASGTDKGPSNE